MHDNNINMSNTNNHTLEVMCVKHSSTWFSYTEVHLILTITLLATPPLPPKLNACVLKKEVLLKIQIPTEYCVEAIQP